jgi:hypothetical protein
LRTKAGAAVIESRMRCTPGRTCCFFVRRRRVAVAGYDARARWNGWVRSASSSRSARQRLEHVIGGAAQVSALELGVVVDADAVEQRYFLPAQPGDAAVVAAYG